MMKKIYLSLSTVFLLFSCNNEALDKEIENLKYQNAELKKQSLDSVKIYNIIKQDKNQIFAEKFVDSLRKSNPKLLENIEKEINYSMFSSSEGSH